jgi:adenylate cyclase
LLEQNAEISHMPCNAGDLYRPGGSGIIRWLCTFIADPAKCCSFIGLLAVLYRFNTCALDMMRGCLRVDGAEVSLRPKSFEVLRYLVQNPGRLIAKDELIQAVWPSTTVTDESLTNCVADVRLAIGDRDRSVIKTVPRRGYLFTATVTSEAPAARERGPDPLPERPAIAVLAFDNLSGDPAQEYFSDGFTEDIITELSRFSELRVIARNSTFTYKGRAVDVRQVGRELGVRYVLEGSVRRDGDRIRISAQLIDAATGAHRWAERYDRNIESVFAVQDEVARTIAGLLAAHVSKAEATRTLTKPPPSWQAYDCYMRAADTFAAFYASLKAEQLYETRRLLERALALDPTYARAWGMLSCTYVMAWNQPLDGDFRCMGTLDRAHKLAQQAVQLDPHLPQARAYLGLTLMWRRQSDAAIAEFQKAVALNPNFTDVRFSIALIYAGQAERAIEVTKAHMRLDPFYIATTPGWLGLACYMLQRYAEALPPLRECVARTPDFRAGHMWLAATCAQLGLMDEARTQVAEVLRLQPDFTIAGTLTPFNAFKSAADAEHYLDGLRKAGLPER